ncbi:MAG: DUF2846 domain-containing protein [Blastomonas sp.]
MMKKFVGLGSAMLLAGAVLGSVSPVLAEEAGKAITIAPPPAGMGQVVFFRTGGSGFALGCQVNQNDQRVSALGAGKYFVHVAAPGPQTFMVSSEAKDVLNLEVEAEETQYVRCKIKMGIMVGRPNLEPSTKADFDKASHKLKLVDADDMGPKAP